MQPDIIVRAANAADRPAILRIIANTLSEYGLEYDADGIDGDLPGIPDNYAAAGGWFYVLLDDAGEVIGTFGVWPLDEQHIELRKMYFCPAARGAGSGKAVLDFVLQRAAEMGYQAVDLETARQLREAIGLYKSFGFEMLPEPPETRRCDYRMRLPLSSYTAPAGLRHVRVA